MISINFKIKEKGNFKIKKIISVNKKKLTAIENLCIMELDLEMEGYYGS